MKKTVLRTANTQSVNSLTDYLNTTTRFTGLNDSTNFTSVDQNSFSDCDNVFVNADDELSTRPPVVIQDFDISTIKNIQQVNSLTFYVTTDYVIHWKHNDGWESIQCEAFEDIYITDYDDYYLIFTRNSAGTVSLAGLKYLFDSDTFETYTSEELIYIPFTTVYYGATVNDSAENKNLLTTAFRSQYIFSIGITTPSSSLDGETVTIHLGDDEYTVLWDETIPQRFCKNIGTIRVSEDDTVIFDHVRMNDNGVYFAWFNYNRTGSKYMYAMYSLDGNVWGKLTYPSAVAESSTKVFTYTDNGLTVWLYEYLFENHVDDNGTRESNPTTTIYYINLSMTVQNYVAWQSIEIDTLMSLNHYVVVMPIQITSSGSVTYTANWWGILFDFNSCYTISSGARSIAIHAAEDGEFVLLIPTYVNLTQTYRSYSSGATVSDGTFSDGTVTITDTNIATSVNSNTGTYTGMILVTCKNYTVTSSTFYYNPAAPHVSSSIPETIYSALNRTTIHYQPNDTLSLICIDTYKTNSNASALILSHYCVAVDEDLIPQFNYFSNNYDPYNGTGTLTWVPQCVFPVYFEDGETQFTYDGVLSNNNAFKSNNTNGKFYVTTFYNCIDDSKYSDIVSLYSESNEFTLFTAYNSTVTQMLKATSITVTASKVEDYEILHVQPFYNVSGTINSITIKSYDSQPNDYQSDKIFVTTTDDSISDVAAATCDYYYYGSTLYEYLDIYGSKVQTPINITTDGYITYATEDNKIYSNYFTDEWSVYHTEYGNTTLLMPFKVEDFITHTFMIDNLLYQSQSRTIEDDAGLLYIPENSKVVLPTQITESVVFSQTVLAVFTDTTAYEYTYDNDNDVYRLYPTKLQLGNREGYEICTAFDGLTIYMSTVFGYKSLTYESFVQSTEQAFTDCCAAINSIFNSYDDAPIKQAQYNYWIFLYKQTSNQMLVYDTRYDDTDYDNIRYPAWFKWTLPYNINKIWYEGRTFYLWLSDNNIYTMEFTDTSIYDITAISKQPITWFIRSQKLHFSYPAYYKHVSMLTSITLQNDIKLRYNLKFYNYRNAYDTEHVDTVEYPIETLGICNKRVNFMKTNAFQYEISNDDTDQYPSRFVLSSIVIKFRVTEKIR